MEAVQIRRVDEFQIGAALRQEIAGMLERAFPGYPKGRNYYMQLPVFRFLATENGAIIGHLAVEHRMVNMGGVPVRVFGVSDLCVEDAFRGKRIGSLLIEKLEQEGIDSGVDFILLVASDKDFYRLNGYEQVKNPCRWVSIENHHTLELVQRSLAGDLMVKSLGSKKWGEGLVDLLGTMF